MTGDLYRIDFLPLGRRMVTRCPRVSPGDTMVMLPEMKEDLLDRLEEARELLRFDLRLPTTADDHDISRRLKREKTARMEAA